MIETLGYVLISIVFTPMFSLIYKNRNSVNTRKPNVTVFIMSGYQFQHSLWGHFEQISNTNGNSHGRLVLLMFQYVCLQIFLYTFSHIFKLTPLILAKVNRNETRSCTVQYSDSYFSSWSSIHRNIEISFFLNSKAH